LCHQAFKAIRLLHKNNTRIEDTANDALMRLADTAQSLIKPEDADKPSLEPAEVDGPEMTSHT
jgi:flavin-binding protein dodecin